MSQKVNLENLRDLIDPSLSTNADGSLSFSLDGQRVVLLPQDDTLVVHVTLGTVPATALSFVMQFMLEENFLLSQSRGGAYSLHGDSPVLGIDFRLPAPANSDALLLNQINNVIVAADQCRERLDAALQKHFADTQAKLRDLQEFGPEPSPGTIEV